MASDAFYDVSVTAAALRMVQLSKDSRAFVVSDGETVDWCFRSEALRIQGMRRGTPVSTRTVATGAIRDGLGVAAALEVDIALRGERRFEHPTRSEAVPASNTAIVLLSRLASVLTVSAWNALPPADVDVSSRKARCRASCLCPGTVDPMPIAPRRSRSWMPRRQGWPAPLRFARP